MRGAGATNGVSSQIEIETTSGVPTLRVYTCCVRAGKPRAGKQAHPPTEKDTLPLTVEQFELSRTATERQTRSTQEGQDNTETQHGKDGKFIEILACSGQWATGNGQRERNMIWNASSSSMLPTKDTIIVITFTTAHNDKNKRGGP